MEQKIIQSNMNQLQVAIGNTMEVFNQYPQHTHSVI